MVKRAVHHFVQHLVPTKHNGFIPHLLREGSIWAMLGIGLALFSFVQFARVSGYFGLTAEVYPAVIVSLTNKDRTINNLSSLSVSPTLEAAAKLKANDMASKGYFAHTSPEGVTPWHWFAEAGYKFIYAGENLAINYHESEAVQNAWLDSPTHRANIMNGNFTEMGVATATGEYNGIPTMFVVELFGMPATAKVAAAEPIAQAPVPAPATSVRVVSSHPAPTKTQAPTKVSPSEVAGESAPAISVIKETSTFTLAQNTDTSLVPAPAEPSPTPAPKISFLKRLVLQGDKIAGLIMQAIVIALIIATAGMVAREYEKHHKKHMAYGTLLIIVMSTFLFVGRIGVFDKNPSLASAFTLEER